MSKLYRVDLNIDKEGISPQQFINKTTQLEGGGFGEYSPAQFAVNLMMNAVVGGHPKGNLQSLRRTLKLKDTLEAAAANGGVAERAEDDVKYLKGSFDKCSDWNNNPEAALVVDRVYRTLEKAEEVT